MNNPEPQADQKNLGNEAPVASTQGNVKIQKCPELLRRYVLAIDDIYNHNEAARQAVVVNFGTVHPREVWRAIGLDALSEKVGRLH
jgi:hypothetical protein